VTRSRPAGCERGQALVETALTIPVMFALTLGFLALLVRVEAQVELDSATSLAAAAAVSAPAGSTLSASFAGATWRGTLSHYRYREPQGLTGCGAYTPGEAVTCTGRVTLLYSQTPMGAVVPLDVELSSTASAQSSGFRARP